MMTDDKVPIVIFGVLIVGLITIVVGGWYLQREYLAHHDQQIAACMKAGHERLWCEGLLK